MKIFESIKSFVSERASSKSALIPSNNVLASLSRKFRAASSESDPYGALAGWVYFALDTVASSFASVEFFLYTKKGDGVGEVLDHELIDLMEAPNKMMTGRELRYLIAFMYQIWGISYLYKLRQGRKVVEIWPLRPDLIRVKTNKDGMPTSYEYRVPGGQMMTIAVEDIVIPLRKPSPETIIGGMSPFKAITHEIDADMAMVIWSKHFLENGAEPGGVLETDGTLSDTQFERLHTSWSARHKGAGNANKVAILEAGLRYKQVSVTPKELDYVASRTWSRDIILTIFGVPKGLVIADDVNRANADAAQYVFLSRTVEPLCKLYYDSLNVSLTHEFDSSLWLWIDPLTQQDREQLRGDITAYVDKVLTRNEARTLLGYEPVDGGDMLFQGFSEIPLDQMSDDVKMLKVSRGQPGFYKKVARLVDKRNARIERKAREATERAVSSTAVRKMLKSLKATDGKDEWKGIPERVKAERLNYVTKVYPKRAKEFRKKLKEAFSAQEDAVLTAMQELSGEKSSNGWVHKLTVGQYLEDVDMGAVVEDVYVASILDGAGAVHFGVGGTWRGERIVGPTSEVVKKFLETRMPKFADDVNATTADRITKTLKQGLDAGETYSDMQARVVKVFKQAKGYRSESIVRTEVGSAQNYGRFHELDNLGATKKIWVATGFSTRDWHAEANGQVVDIDKPFDVNGEELMHPHDSDGSPENVINCQCTISEP